MVVVEVVGAPIEEEEEAEGRKTFGRVEGPSLGGGPGRKELK